MAFTVVDLFQPVNVDVGQNKTPVSMARAIHVAFEDEHSHLAAKGAGELVKLSSPQFGPRLFVIFVGSKAVRDCRLAVSSRAFAILQRLPPVRGPLMGLDVGLVAIARGLLSIRDRMAAILGRMPPTQRPLASLRVGLVPIGRIVVTISRRMLTVLSRLSSV